MVYRGRIILNAISERVKQYGVLRIDRPIGLDLYLTLCGRFDVVKSCDGSLIVKPKKAVTK